MANLIDRDALLKANMYGNSAPITDPKFYVWPRRLKEFGLTRAPQSWCYFEEVD